MTVTKVDNFQSFEQIINSSEKVLVKFEADWCSPCKAMAPVVEEIARRHPDYTVVAVDVDGEGMEEALESFQVRSVPTFIHLQKGNAVKKACGAISKAELLSLVEDV